MNDLPSIVIPDVKPRRASNVEWREFLQQWREDYAAGRETIPPPENIRYEHNLDWRSNWLSIQAAHDNKYLFWKIGRVLMYAAAYGMVLVDFAWMIFRHYAH